MRILRIYGPVLTISLGGTFRPFEPRLVRETDMCFEQILAAVQQSDLKYELFELSERLIDARGGTEG